jgi:fluoroacetyl-CoA thioesterase
MGLVTGLAGTAELKVADEDTAISLGSGEVPVLGTPRLIALCEAAAMRAVDGHLGEDCTTVGFRVQLDHLRPTAVGHAVIAEAHLDKIEGHRLLFSVNAKDDRGLVAAGRVTRVVVQFERFMEKTL